MKQVGFIVALFLFASAALAQTEELEGALEDSDPTLSSGEYYKVHSYEGQAGESLEFYLRSEEFDPYLAIVDPEGDVLAEEDDSEGYGRDVFMTLTLPKSGSYSLLVTSAFAGETGRYTLSISRQESESVDKGVDKPSATVTPSPVPTPGPAPAPPAPTPEPAVSSSGQTSRFFLIDNENVHNTTDPTVEVDAAGGIHMVYPTYAVGDAFYAYCPADCGAPERMSYVKLPTDGTVANVMLALDANNRPQVLMSTMLRVYYATCTGDCTDDSSWQVSVILEHGGDREVSGEAFALDPQGRPRFVMHTYRAYLGIGQAEPATFYVLCDDDCHNPASWQAYKISPQIWQDSQLRFTAEGQPRLATVATVEDLGDIAGYIECNADCTNEDEENWLAAGLEYAYSNRYVETIDPSISMVLTSTGAPRLLILGKTEDGGRRLVYYFCEANCVGEEAGPNWASMVLIHGDAAEDIGPGLDLALDRQDRPRFVYTVRYNILMGYCDVNCESLTEDNWNLIPVEMGSDLEADPVIPYWNCAIAAWFFKKPSLAIGLDGLPRVAFQAEDISGPYGVPDPNHPLCKTGADMTLSRFAQLGSYAR